MKGEPLTSATHRELIGWVDKHAGLEKLCERGGWPDGATLRMDVCSREGDEMIANVFFIEAVREISVCEPVREERCGKFAIIFDAAGKPESIRLLYPM